MQLLQVAAAEAAARRGQRLQDGAGLWRGQIRVALKAPEPRGPAPAAQPPPTPSAGGAGRGGLTRADVEHVVESILGLHKVHHEV